MQPLLSIICLTYNQEKFIEQTLNGFLMQKTNFDLEIVIHNDCSTDSTLEIINKYAEQYPSKFRVITPPHNRYKTEGLIPIYKDVIDSCNTKYIAYCEGDDYYTDPLKLQKQVDALEANPHYMLSYTGFRKYRNDSKRFSSYNSQKHYYPSGNIFDILIRKNYPCAATTVFRVKEAQDAMVFIAQHHEQQRWQTLDYPLWLYLAKQGEVHYLPDVTTVFRFSNTSISSEKRVDSNIDFVESIHDIQKTFAQHFDVDQQIITEIDDLNAFHLYKYAMKHRLKRTVEFRAKFLEKRIKGLHKKQDFYAQNPWLERFYF